MNALIATLVAFANWRKLNFMSVTSSVPPTTSTTDGVSTNAPTEPPSTIAVPTTMHVPMRPINVAKSKAVTSSECRGIRSRWGNSYATVIGRSRRFLRASLRGDPAYVLE